MERSRQGNPSLNCGSILLASIRSWVQHVALPCIDDSGLSYSFLSAALPFLNLCWGLAGSWLGWWMRIPRSCR